MAIGNVNPSLSIWFALLAVPYLLFVPRPESSSKAKKILFTLHTIALAIFASPVGLAWTFMRAVEFSGRHYHFQANQPIPVDNIRETHNVLIAYMKQDWQEHGNMGYMLYMLIYLPTMMICGSLVV